MQRLSGRIIGRFSALAFILLCILLIYHDIIPVDLDRFNFLSSPYVPTHTKSDATCPAHQWVQGEWAPKSNYSFSAMADPNEVVSMAGFQRCASNREVDWHLGGPRERPDRFPKVFSFEWHGGCGIRPFAAEDMIKDLVEQGGWLLLGDSLTEGHFFSISCSLGEHVRAEPVYQDGHPGDIAYIPQHLYLKPDSPLISRIDIPKGFNIATTPIVTFLRCDFLMRIETLNRLYKSLHNPPADFKLFREENHKTSGPEDYMPIFTNPNNRYSTMIVSTAAWWNTETLTGLKDPEKPIEHGTPELIQFYSDAMDLWASLVQKALFKDQGRHLDQNRRQAIVRGFPGGHDDCFNQHEPWKVDLGHPVKHYNWPWISIMNEKFEKVVKDYLDIHFLGIDHPARLRPDSHVTWDCLHYAAGTGVNEGWTHYMWYYVTNLASRGLLAGKAGLESRPPRRTRFITD